MFKKLEELDYILNFYRYKLYDNKNKIYLITLDTGEYLFVENKNFSKLKKGYIDDINFFNKLEKKGVIINTKNIDKIILKTKKRYFFLFNPVSLHIVIPTNRCNLSCKYVYMSQKVFHILFMVVNP